MSTIVATAITETTPIQDLVDTFSPLVGEFRMHYNDDGIHVRAIDPAGVAFAHVEVSKTAFESYDSPGEAVVGINLERFDDNLGLANPDDLVKLALDMEERRLQMTIRNIEQTLGLIDPDSIRKEPNMPDLDLPNRVVVEGRELQTAVTAADMVSDHVSLQADADPDGGGVELTAQGDTDDTAVDLSDVSLEASIPESTLSIFSLDYMKGLVKPIPADAEVEIRFGDEQPMIWSWEAAGGHTSVEQFLAPRIVPE